MEVCGTLWQDLRMAGRLAGKAALVVGGGAVAEGWGIGRAISVLFAREGAKVFCADLDPAAARRTQELIEAEGGTCVPGQVDATDSASVLATVNACVAAFGRIDILHNNVGVSTGGGLLDLTEEQWDRDIAVNLKSAFLACRHTVPLMRDAGGGSIVHTASINGKRHTVRNVIAYSAAKGGMLQLSRNIAHEFLAVGIRSNCVVPGMIETPRGAFRMKNELGWTDEKIAQTLADRRSFMPGARVGTGWDIAYAALYLASDESKYVTGSEVIVDGGLSSRG
jgi:NAD(P)-dependent dehydrogenase (short-subunit alcohol dehydrogenase family)